MVAEKEGCDIMDIKVGEIRPTQDGLRAVWVRCPIPVANKLASMGRIRIGWIYAKVELLNVRPLQCYKCLQPSHVKQTCPNGWDNSDRSYRCGGPGHKARTCVAPPRCMVCEEAGKPADHRIGGPACPLPRARRRQRGEQRRGGENPTQREEDRALAETPMEIEEAPKEQRQPRKVDTTGKERVPTVSNA